MQYENACKVPQPIPSSLPLHHYMVLALIDLMSSTLLMMCFDEEYVFGTISRKA